MHSPLAFLKFGVKASLNACLFGVGGDLAVEVLPAMAKDLWNWWGKGRKEPELRDEAQSLAQLPVATVRQLVEQAVAEEAADQPLAVRQAATAYFTQLPGTIRQASRRPADPTGRTIPQSLPLSKPDDLMPFLPARLPRFKPGDRPAGIGDWELQELLGVGGFGEVWKAHNKDLGDVVALKFCCDARAAHSLRNELALLGRVQREGRGHGGIVQLRHSYLNAEVPCLEYEYVAGGDLAGLIHQWHRAPSANLVEQASRLLHGLAQIVAFAHRLSPSIVHRDLKPANILLQSTADGKVSLRVADFGIGGVAAKQAIAQTSSGTTRGQFLATALRGACTPLYASPQQRRGDEADPRDDVYSLGVIWLQLLCGDLTLEVTPDWRDDLAERKLPDDVMRLLSDCLASKVEKRLPDAGALAERLGRLVGAPAPRVVQAIPVATVAEDDPTDHVLGLLSRAQAAHRQARALAEQQHDYAGAAELLRLVPENLRDAALYAGLCERRDRVVRLDREMQSALKEVRLDDLRPVVEELLELTPGREKLRRLLDSLPPVPREIVNAIGMKLVLIPKGKFLMGSPDSEAERQANEGPVHEVEITRPFYLGAFPVTQAQYQKVMGSNPSQFSGNPNNPVEQVSWDDAVAFCKKLSEMTEEQRKKRLYRLPTEAEWEYSCRGGAISKPFHFGASLSSTHANFDGRYPYGGAPVGPYLQRTTPVGSYAANAFGLYDMHGNVWEWCIDWFDDAYYNQSPRQDPQGPHSGERRVLRGGSWSYNGRNCRAAYRDGGGPGNRFHDIGFRVLFPA